jgi:hypothetical protein
VLGNARVLEYAILDESVTYSGHSSLFVGNVKEHLKELGPVPRLAIAQDLKTGEIMLLHCDQDWEVLGLGGNYDSVAKAKASAERAYHFGTTGVVAGLAPQSSRQWGRRRRMYPRPR